MGLTKKVLVDVAELLTNERSRVIAHSRGYELRACLVKDVGKHGQVVIFPEQEEKIRWVSSHVIGATKRKARKGVVSK